jgi:hypothetical protein
MAMAVSSPGAQLVLPDVAPAAPQPDDGIQRGAVFSPCRTYRYLLTRTWDKGSGIVNFIMLNPSTADAQVDDPTIRRCISFARAWGFNSLTVTNLFAFRATDPDELKTAPDPVGPRNDETIVEQAGLSERVVCAWGTHGSLKGRAWHVRQLLARQPRLLSTGVPLWILGLTQEGHPRHPLYLSKRMPCIRWE